MKLGAALKVIRRKSVVAKCEATGVPAGTRCQVRLLTIAKRPTLLGTAVVTLVGGKATVKVTPKRRSLVTARRAKAVRVLVEAVTPKGAVLASLSTSTSLRR